MCNVGIIFLREKLRQGAGRHHAFGVTEQSVPGPPSLAGPLPPAGLPFHTPPGSHGDPLFGWFRRFKFTNRYSVVHFAKNCSNVHTSGANFQEGKLA